MKKHLKKIFIALLIVAVLVWIGFLLKKYNKDQSNPALFTSPDGSFSTELPKAWDAQIADASKGAIVVTFVTDSIQTTSNNKPYINIAKGALSGDLNTLYAETLEKYKRVFRKLQIVQEADLLIWNDPGKKLVFDGTMGGKITRYAVVLVSHNGVIYTLTASSAATDFDQVHVVIDGIIKEWKFLQ